MNPFFIVHLIFCKTIYRLIKSCEISQLPSESLLLLGNDSGIMKLLSGILTLLLATFSTWAQPLINYQKTDALLQIAPHVAYLADTAQNLTFAQVRQLPQAAFTINGKDGLSLGNQDLPHWFRIDFAPTTASEDLYLYTDFPLHYLDVYSTDQNDSLKVWKTGLLRPFGGRHFLTNNYSFNLGRNPKQVIFRAQSPTLHLPFLLGTIQPLVAYTFKYDLLIGGLLGIILALALYNLFLFFSLKDLTFLYYAGYELTLFHLVFKGMGTQQVFFTQNNPSFNSDNITSVVICALFSFLFVNKFLNVKALAPKLYTWNLVVLLALLGLMLTEWLLPYRAWHNNALDLLIITNALSVILGGIYTWYLGYEPAKYFTLAWSLFLLSVIVRFLGLSNVLPKHLFLVDYAAQFGIALESLLLSFAVAYRFNLFRKEARDAHALVLQRSEENEKLLLANNRILQEKLKLEQDLYAVGPANDLQYFFEKMQIKQVKNKKLAVSTMEGVLLLPVADIIRLEALGSYCTIYLTQQKKIVASKSMCEFEPMLDKSDFIRVHKSHIINLTFVERYVRGEGGTLVMPDGAEVSVSRGMKIELLERLNIA